MKSNILTIMNKELSRFFKDPRMVIALLIPGVMIYFMYSFIVPLVVSSALNEQDVPSVHVVNMPASMEGAINELGVEWTETDAAGVDAVKEAIQDSENGVLIVFPADFDGQVSQYRVSSGLPAPNVQIFYNSVSTGSEQLYSRITALLDTYESSIANRFDVNRDTAFDLATDEGMVGQLFSMIMPMVLMTLMFSSCMSFAPDAIAGEKERGTLATLLVTPVKRYEIVVGKILALSIIAVIGGAVSFVGTAFALPNLIGFADLGLSVNVYPAGDYALLFTIITTSVLLMISMISMISAWAKSTKEAGSLISPLLFVVIFVSILPMMGGDKPAHTLLYLVPFYNSVQCMNDIFTFARAPLNILLANVSNLVYAGIFVFVMARMFNNEKIMFAR